MERIDQKLFLKINIDGGNEIFVVLIFLGEQLIPFKNKIEEKLEKKSRRGHV